MKVGRNEPCPCGSGRKYKNCHLITAPASLPEDQVWQEVHALSPRLLTDVLQFVKTRYGSALLDEAWREFTLGEEESFDEESIHLPLFVPWFFYEWKPDPQQTLVPKTEVGTFPVASAYLKHRGRYESPLAIRYLRACLDSAFTFLDVLAVSPGAGFTMRDALTGRESRVIEKTASQMVQKGDILFGMLVTVDGISVLDGCSPTAFPPLEKASIIDLRKRIQKDNATVTPKILRQYQLEKLEVYHTTRHRLLNPLPPVLQNTDGEPLMFCRVIYAIPSAREAFDALRHLSLGKSEDDLLAGATFGDDADLVAVEIPWLKKGNAKMPDWENTVLGQIQIEGRRLVAKVNSEQRARLFRQIADPLLPAGSRHLSTLLESLEAAAERERSEGFSEPVVDDSPEAKAVLAEHQRSYYRAWPNMKLPALKGKSPRQAMKTPEGREMVEALLLDLERGTRAGQAVDPEILAELRATLRVGVHT